MATPAWYQFSEHGIILSIHAQPGAKCSEIAGLHGDRLKIRLQAPAVEGKANIALIAFLAERLQVSKAHVLIISGQESRQKRVKISGLKLLPDCLQNIK